MPLMPRLLPMIAIACALAFLDGPDAEARTVYLECGNVDFRYAVDFDTAKVIVTNFKMGQSYAFTAEITSVTIVWWSGHFKNTIDRSTLKLVMQGDSGSYGTGDCKEVPAPPNKI